MEGESHTDRASRVAISCAHLPAQALGANTLLTRYSLRGAHVILEGDVASIGICGTVAEPACILSFTPVRRWRALPAASQPTQSMQTSAPSRSVIFLMWTAMSPTD